MSRNKKDTNQLLEESDAPAVLNIVNQAFKSFDTKALSLHETVVLCIVLGGILDNVLREHHDKLMPLIIQASMEPEEPEKEEADYENEVNGADNGMKN